MAQVVTTVFRKYDIRGTVAGANPQLTPDLARYVGKALGTYLPKEFRTERVFVGQDNRMSSEPLRLALMDGLTSTGMNVTDIGQVLTPTVYFASASYGERGAGVMITGSHLDTSYNGIKMAYGSLALADQQIQELLKIIQADAFAAGQGTVVQDFDMLHKHMEAIKTKVKIARPLNVVMDAGNGLSGSVVPQVLRDLGINVTCLYCEPDGTYPNHLPNPEDPEMTKDLEAKVVEVGADLGLAFDGDSDRCGFIDNHGHHIAADRLLALLARDLLSRQPGASIVFDVKASLAQPDEIRKYGGVPVMWKTGHSLMKLKMHEVGSPLGGEMSGHIFIGEDYYGFDDAYLAAGRLLQVLAANRQPLSALSADIPMVYSTPEYRPRCPDERKEAVIDGVSAILANKGEAITVDGIRVKFERGWGLLRASNTDSVLSLRFEGETEADALAYRDLFFAALQTFPEVEVPAL